MKRADETDILHLLPVRFFPETYPTIPVNFPIFEKPIQCFYNHPLYITAYHSESSIRFSK